MSESNLFINADALDRGAEGLADSVVAGLSSAASEALGDPIVRALMAADGVERAGLEGLLRSAAARLQAREHATRASQHRCYCGAHGA
jgi:hypothetical protein